MADLASRPMGVDYFTGSPSPVRDISYSIIGKPGSTTYFYWVIANYSWGSAPPRAPLIVSNAPNVLSASNSVSLSWLSPSPQIVNYTVLRTITNQLPVSGSSTGVVVNTLNTFVTDIGSSLVTATFSPIPAMRAVVFLDGTGPTPVLVSTVGQQVNGNLTITGLIDEQGVGGQGGNLASFHNYIVTLAPPNWIVSAQGLSDVTVPTAAATEQDIPLQLLPSNAFVVSVRTTLLLGPVGGVGITTAQISGVGSLIDPVTNPNGGSAIFAFPGISLLAAPSIINFQDSFGGIGASTLEPAELTTSVQTTGGNITALTPPCQFRISVLWGVTSDIGAPA